jgi:hypothetical protein
MHDTVPSQAASASPFALHLTLETFGRPAPELRRVAAGLSLSALYGLAIGARAGGVELLRNAFGVPLALVVSALVVVPSLTVSFAILDVPVDASRVLGAIGRALASVGLVLAGLAPGVLLLCLSVESRVLVHDIAFGGICLAGGLGLVQLVATLVGSLVGAERAVARKGYLLLAGHALFAAILAVRLVASFVPALGGAA